MRAIYIGLHFYPWPHGKLMRWFGSKWSHASIIDARDAGDRTTWMVLEMTARGCIPTPWFHHSRGQEWMVLARPGMTDEDVRAVATAAYALVGVPYGYLSLPWAAWRVLKDWWNALRFSLAVHRAHMLGLEDWGFGFTLICSEYAAKVFHVAGLPLFGETTLVMPDDFDRLYREGHLVLVDRKSPL